MGIIEKIKEIEAEMARTQKNKATGLDFLSCLDFLILSLIFHLDVASHQWMFPLHGIRFGFNGHYDSTCC